eukprot:gnl/Ergobibamus_cyprinoides/319.p1 GENE.gnl/Ergobibamus_cyprinoides/319~~gnl/Ergobibamus_cyprinoides/319.p1  ORF type:complete len:264 (+),score=70.04 gnl/Ergobibamus_cyprinoides/319:138-929(+)
MCAPGADAIEQVKGVSYSLSSLLGVKLPATPSPAHPLIRHPEQGHKLFYTVIYLSPGDYHRLHSPTEWSVRTRRHFPGALYPVNASFMTNLKGLLSINERVVLDGDWRYGFFSYTAVGAYNVGSIDFTFDAALKTNRYLPMREQVKVTADSRRRVRAPTSLAGSRNSSSPDVTEAGLDPAAARVATYEPAVELDAGSEIGRFRLGSTVVLVFEAPEDFAFSIDAGDTVRVGGIIGCCAADLTDMTEEEVSDFTDAVAGAVLAE